MYDELQLKAYSTELDQAIKRLHSALRFRLRTPGNAAEEVIDRLRARGNREFARIADIREPTVELLSARH